jgi:hypothetical protein
MGESMVDRNEVTSQLRRAIYGKQIDRIQELCREHPWLVTDHIYKADETTKLKKSWIIFAVEGLPGEGGDYKVIQTMLDLGFNINGLNLPEKWSVIDIAIHYCNMEMLKFVLSKGANPNLGRPLIGAMRCDQRELRLPFVQNLVEHGADVNRLYPIYGDENNLFTALDWATDPKIADYLRAHGAKTRAEIRGGAGVTSSGIAAGSRTFADEVVAYFNEHFGPVNERSQIEVVPTGHSVAIHAIEPGSDRTHLTLFTTGLSSTAMNVPEGQERFALAELFMQLPADWQYSEASDATFNWPTSWLRRIAQFPHDNGTWLGGPVALIANDDPPKPLGPNVRFTTLLLMAEKSFVRSDGRTVQLYRVTPLYTDERELEIREGIPALLRAFDRKSVQFVVDLSRRSVVEPSL